MCVALCLTSFFCYIGAETLDIKSWLQAVNWPCLNTCRIKTHTPSSKNLRYVCTAANSWDNTKKLLRLLTLLKGHAWAIFDSLGEDSTDMYAHLKTALLQCLSPDTEEDHLVARELLSKRKLPEGKESIDEVARDLEELLDKASPGPPSRGLRHGTMFQF